MFTEEQKGAIQQLDLRLLMIRHGETNSNANLMQNGNVVDNIEPILTKLGNQQAYVTAKYLEINSHILPKYIVCSPMRRCLETLKPLIPFIKQNNIPVKIQRDLYEKNGLTWLKKGVKSFFKQFSF